MYVRNCNHGWLVTLYAAEAPMILTIFRFQAYKDAQDENKVVPGTNTPTRSNGIVSRAMEYMFGW